MTITARRVRRGQPLVFLAVLLAGWLSLRVVLWEPPFDLADDIRDLAERTFLTDSEERAGMQPAFADASNLDEAGAPAAQPIQRIVLGVPILVNTFNQPFSKMLPSPLDNGVLSVPNRREMAFAQPAGVRRAVGHALLTMMGLSQLELPRAVAAYLDFAERTELVVGPSSGVASAPVAIAQAGIDPNPAAAVSRRWSADGWVLARDDTTRSLVAGQPSYGRSQAGAVLRFRLRPSSGHAPQAYARVSTALRSPRDGEVAAGLSARPLARVPVRVSAEVRVADLQSGTDVRPAVFTNTEFPPFVLPLGTQGEAYAQGGYVGGDFGTPFIDGQMRVTRQVTRLGRANLAAGAAAWGGAQKGASRLDIGPSASVSFGLGQIYSRLSLDYRVRIAGNAQPKSGPAFTLSAGF